MFATAEYLQFGFPGDFAWLEVSSDVLPAWDSSVFGFDDRHPKAVVDGADGGAEAGHVGKRGGVDGAGDDVFGSAVDFG